MFRARAGSNLKLSGSVESGIRNLLVTISLLTCGFVFLNLKTIIFRKNKTKLCSFNYKVTFNITSSSFIIKSYNNSFPISQLFPSLKKYRVIEMLLESYVFDAKDAILIVIIYILQKLNYKRITKEKKIDKCVFKFVNLKLVSGLLLNA